LTAEMTGGRTAAAAPGPSWWRRLLRALGF